MSLRHLYLDLNELGIYPDLIDGKKSGDEISINDMVIFHNKYYGIVTLYETDYDGEEEHVMILFNWDVKIKITWTETYIRVMYGKEYHMIIDNDYDLVYEGEILGDVSWHVTTGYMCSDLIYEIYKDENKDVIGTVKRYLRWS